MISVPQALWEAENKKKRESRYLLSVPLIEALVQPISVERTAQKPHADDI